MCTKTAGNNVATANDKFVVLTSGALMSAKSSASPWSLPQPAVASNAAAAHADGRYRGQLQSATREHG